MNFTRNELESYLKDLKKCADKTNNVVGVALSSPYFYLALLGIVLGTILFVTGFLAELVGRNSPTRNTYLIEKELLNNEDNK